jgi:hypothetical protein
VAGGWGLFAIDGTVSISGGQVSGSAIGALASRGSAVSISGGSVTGAFGVEVVFGGTATISGCNALDNPLPFGAGTQYTLSGTLLDGTVINTAALVFPPGQIVLNNHCTPSSLANLVAQFVTDPAVVQGLTDKLNAIATAIAQGNARAKAGIVGAFVNQVKAQTGKSITPQQAAILTQLVGAL